MENSVLFSKAVSFAAKKHQTQTRRDGSPYILHPLKVAEIVRESGYDLRYQMVAVLHDTLEDTDATEEEIRFFGDDVYEAVQLLTRPEGMDEEEYINKILENPMAAIVKAADKIHNMREVTLCEDKLWAMRYIKKSQKYYYGKFNRCVDEAISYVYYAASAGKKVKRDASSDKNNMKLYREIEKERYESDKANYNESEWPVREANAHYYRVDGSDSFLYEINNQYYFLRRNGWKKLDRNPIFEAKTPEEEYPMSSEAQFDAFIAREKERRQYLRDFVNIDKL